MRGSRSFFALSIWLCCLVVLSGCVGPRWRASALLLDADKLVADAFGEAPLTQGMNPLLVPTVPAPTSLRPCCALGMDQRVRYGGVPLYGYAVSTVTDVASFGPHEYDNGSFTIDSNGHMFGLEHNGIVYTCRGGFVDTAHVRDNADMTFFLATRLLAAWPGPVEVKFETADAWTTVLVTLPPDLATASDPFLVAAQVAEWLGYQQGLWHEIAQWWGYESVGGYSEEVSAFSEEDFYSNALGVRLGGLAVRHRLFRSREDYNAGIDALLAASMRLLGSVSLAAARDAMKVVDNGWWSSGFDLPDNRAVPRRSFQVTTPMTPWLLRDAELQTLPATISPECRDAAPHPMTWPERIGAIEIGSFAEIQWSPKNWVKPHFPFVSADKLVRAKDLPYLVGKTREDMSLHFAADFAGPRLGK